MPLYESQAHPTHSRQRIKASHEETQTLSKIESELEVRLYGKRVGGLERDERNWLHFGYDWNWIKEETNPPLSISLPVQPHGHSVHTTERWFEALLAEGNRRKQLARIVGAASIDT